jgi:carboxyl-terminal processing protease
MRVCVKHFWSFLFLFICAWGGYRFATVSTFVNPYPVVCDLVSEKIYLDEKTVDDWRRNCLHRSALVTSSSPKKLILKDVSNLLATLQVSHLEVFDPNEVKKIWTGAGLSTGIESEFVDSELVVFNVEKESPAEKAGIRRGDIIVSIDKEQPSPWTAESSSGEFEIKDLKETRTVKLTAGDVQSDDSPQFNKIAAKHAHWVIPSFRANFFDDAAIAKMKTELQSLQSVIVDVRGNPGGNFVAGLRFLSLFICEPTKVGSLLKPRSQQPRSEKLPNDLDDLKQVELLHQNKGLDLWTYNLDYCFKGEVKVLIDGKSSSVAEMVAQALKEVKKAPLMGAPSRGQLLVGVWYPLDELGAGVQISIPEALYQSVKGHQIEGHGVALDQILSYKLPEMRQGQDSWVKSAGGKSTDLSPAAAKIVK